MTKVVYSDDGQIKVVRGDYVDEDDQFVWIRTKEKEVRIAKTCIKRFEREIKKD